MKIDGMELMENPSNELAAKSLKSLKTQVSGFKYRKPSKKHLSDKVNVEEQEDTRSLYRTLSPKYYHFYIGHYDEEKYKEKFKDCKNGKIKWRPNGRKWCKVPFDWHGFSNDPVFKIHIDNFMKKHKFYYIMSV